jgi:hypothetical protein
MQHDVLKGLAEYTKQKSIDDKIQMLEHRVNDLTERTNGMPNFIELDVIHCGDAPEIFKTSKVTINPNYITYIENTQDGAIVVMSDNSKLQTTLTKDQILQLIQQKSDKTYIT